MNNNDNINKDSIVNPTLSATNHSDNVKIADHSAENKLPSPDHISAVDNAVHNGGGYIELLEERPVVSKERLDVGKVTVTKHTRTKTIEVPVELIEEYITISTEYRDAKSRDLLSGAYDDKDVLSHVEPKLENNAVVTINDKQVTIGDAPIEIVLSRQVATITKDTYAVQEIAISKSVHTHTDSVYIELQHEELDVQEEGFLSHDNASNTKK